MRGKESSAVQTALRPDEPGGGGEGGVSPSPSGCQTAPRPDEPGGGGEKGVFPLPVLVPKQRSARTSRAVTEGGCLSPLVPKQRSARTSRAVTRTGRQPTFTQNGQVIFERRLGVGRTWRGADRCPDTAA